MEFLEQKGSVAADRKAHFELIKRLWFDFYPRNKNTTKTSSGFEHVFLSEVKKQKIIGLHNWIYFAEAEEKGELNYKGWFGETDFGRVSCEGSLKQLINDSALHFHRRRNWSRSDSAKTAWTNQSARSSSEPRRNWKLRCSQSAFSCDRTRAAKWLSMERNSLSWLTRWIMRTRGL